MRICRRGPCCLMLGVALAMGGCIVHPAASTILTLFAPDDPAMKRTIGFSEVIWTSAQPAEGVGKGWHPREHETYMFFLSEPYPVFDPRFLHLVAARDGGYSVTLFLMRRDQSPGGPPVSFAEYTTDQPLRGRVSFGNLEVDLSRVILNSSDGTQLSVIGRIVARPATPEEVAKRWADYQQTIQGQVSSNANATRLTR